jgi:cell wall-associated NlpC family hydrolase
MLVTEPLLGLHFDWERQNCYTLVREFYALNTSLGMADYPCPTLWWQRGLDLYRTIAPQEGFEPIHCHPKDWRVGDVIMMSIDSTVPNHIGVLLPDGRMLHHLVGQLSGITMYGGLFRNTTVAVYRNKVDLFAHVQETNIDFVSLLPPHVRRRVENLKALNSPQASVETRS